MQVRPCGIRHKEVRYFQLTPLSQHFYKKKLNKDIMREITPVDTIDAIVHVPGSKSLTQRALIAAALAKGE
ncbi:EPSP synthase (3-phosphoshikimate 1-carboxyvinyltransferase), partial [Candidatus Electrothrix aarhusensis]